MDKLKEKIIEKLAAKEDRIRHAVFGTLGAALGGALFGKGKTKILSSLLGGGAGLAGSLALNPLALESRAIYPKLVAYANKNPNATEDQLIKKEEELIAKYRAKK